MRALSCLVCARALAWAVVGENTQVMSAISPAAAMSGKACTTHVRRLLNRTDDEARYPGVTCVTIFQGSATLDPVFGGVQTAYRKAAVTFFTDVAQSAFLCAAATNVTTPGSPQTAVVVLFDDATLPPAVTAQLAAARTPLLAHSIRKSSRTHAILIPDWNFVANKGFEGLISDLQRRNDTLAQRHPIVFWRGRTTGYSCPLPGRVAVVNASDNDSLAACDRLHPCEDLQRVGAARLAQQHPWLDVKVSGVCQACKPRDELRLAAEGLLLENVNHHNELEWNAHRGILELDGNVNAWGHKWRLGSGSAVFKVDSDWTNAYLEREVAGVHYLPVHANLSNLAEVTRVVMDSAQLPHLESLARNALALAREFSYDAEVARVARELKAAWSLVQRYISDL